jgi:glycosyltransferase involved in cell wall biosynthesis
LKATAMFSVLIPTFNRSDVLARTLDGYVHQSAPYLIHELIVVDDGSSPEHGSVNESCTSKAAAEASFPVTYLRQENTGPAQARNNGIKAATGKIILITGDDIVPHVNLVKEHFFFHKKHDLAEKVCVLGHTRWPPEMRVTPFMEFIHEMGLQFGYSIIENPDDVPFNFFYTSNISVHREFLQADRLFDTDFPHAAWEDIELAYRLKKRGMRMVFNKNALAFHYHPMTFASFRQRQERSGYAAYIFYEKHPELAPFLGVEKLDSNSITARLATRAMEAACLYADERGLAINPKYYARVLDHYYRVGTRRYLNKRKD